MSLMRIDKLLELSAKAKTDELKLMAGYARCRPPRQEAERLALEKLAKRPKRKIRKLK